MSALHMVRLELDVPRLLQVARLEHLPLREVDTGYLVHATLARTLGDEAPGTFFIDEARGRRLPVLGYVSRDAGALRDRAQTYAPPDTYGTVDWDGLSTKPMPQRFEQGRRLGFRLLACPVIRTNSEGERHRKGAEVDAFLAACWKRPAEKVDREQVYREWLGAQLDRHGGVTLASVRLVGFKRERLLRRTQGEARKAVYTERPAAYFEGTLSVADAERFQHLLRRGVGRHRAFGFGMLLLRPAED